jgi:hypothetical protein
LTVIDAVQICDGSNLMQIKLHEMVVISSRFHLPKPRFC